MLFRSATPTRRRQALLVLLFLAGLAAPRLDQLFARDPRGSPEAEGRRAAERPRWRWNEADIQAFPRVYEAHFDDNFGLRYPLLRAHSLSEIGIFGLFPSPSMYIGREGFWFYAEEHSIELDRGLMPFEKSELDRWCETLAAQAQWCRAHGIDYVFAIGPSKEVIYPELVPDKWNRVGPTRYDQLVQRLAGSGVPLLDLRPAIEEEKRHDQPALRDFTYHPLGTHWTERGCWAAAAAIERALAASCPALAPLAREQLSTKKVDLPGDSWAARAYVGDVYTQPYYEVQPQQGWRQSVTRETRRGQGIVLRRGPDPAQPRAVMFRDSFGFKVDEFLAEDCSLLVQSHLAKFDAQLVAEVHPDVVVQLYVDRKLGLDPPVFEPFDETAGLRARFDAAGAPAQLLRIARAPAEAPLAAGAEVELPALALDAERCAVLRVLLDASAPGEFSLECGSATAHAGCGPRRLTLAFVAGRNELFTRLSGRDLAAGARLRLSGKDPVALRELLVRSEPP